MRLSRGDLFHGHDTLLSAVEGEEYSGPGGESIPTLTVLNKTK